MRAGIGTCFGHHGELIQGRFADEAGRLHAGLVTFPCHLFRATAEFIPRSHGGVHVLSADCLRYDKTQRAVELSLQALGFPVHGTLVITSSIPRQRGYGSSTAEVIAAIRAVADAYQAAFMPAEIAALCIAAEQASDALMLDEPVLFGHLDGAILHHFTRQLPPMTVVGVDTDRRGPGVNTNAMHRPRYDANEHQEFATLLETLCHAIDQGDAALVASVATRSAEINLRYLPNPVSEKVLRRYAQWGALGIQVSHSGTVLGVLLPVDAKPDAVAHYLSQLANAPAYHFEIK
jgi:uncharacterized protein involved in propanediol utilization